MKFLHLSDLHLGKQMNDVSLLADQEAVLLGQVVPIARRENVDAVLIAGDVYQRATPQAEAVALFDRFVSELAAMGRRVFIISGNHDSAQRISYFSALVRSAGVYVTEAFEGRMQSVTLSDEYGELTVWMLPFLRPQQVKRFLPEEKIVTYAMIQQLCGDFKKIHGSIICRELLGQVIQLCSGCYLKSQNKYILAAKKLVQEQYSDPTLSLASVAEALGIHPNYLSKLFKTSINLNFIDYLRSCRVQRSRELLERGLSVNAVAEQTGFSSPTVIHPRIQSKRRLHAGAV